MAKVSDIKFSEYLNKRFGMFSRKSLNLVVAKNSNLKVTGEVL